MSKLFQNNLGQIFWYTNIFKYFGRIYSLAKEYVDFFKGEFIWIFICYFLSYQKYSYIHLSNIDGNEYIQIFICQKKGYLSCTVRNIVGGQLSFLETLESIIELAFCIYMQNKLEYRSNK